MVDIFNKAGVGSSSLNSLSMPQTKEKEGMSDPHTNREKLKGKFKLLINHQLPMPKKIEKYANEPVVFYLHKCNNFIKKIHQHSETHKRLEIEKKLLEEQKKPQMHPKKISLRQRRLHNLARKRRERESQEQSV